MKYQRCKRCIMDNASDNAISFDFEGNCNYCNEALERMPTEYTKNENKLASIFHSIKEECKNSKYDCLVGLSGGIDSSYILYLGNKYGLRMLAVHIDDGLDNPVATDNINKLIKATNTELVTIKPNKVEYADMLLSLFKASVPNLAIVQDNLIMSALQEYGVKNNLRYILDGSNFAHECILERRNNINSCDKKYIQNLQKNFGTVKIHDTKLMSLYERYLFRNYFSKLKHIRPLNYIDYDLEAAIHTLHTFSGFTYYGGKHYESILTRFLQCYYLPEKFGVDKRKSHLSSLIISGQLNRDEALEKMKQPLYTSPQLLMEDKLALAKFMNISSEEFEKLISLSPVEEREYRHSVLNELAPIARKFRRLFE